MIYSVRGKVAHLLPTSVVIETESGVDYLVKISLLTSSSISGKETQLEWTGKTKLLTVFKVREDSQDLYGFLNKHDRDTFNLLTSVSGIGPSKAMMLMSTYSSDQINSYIINSQVDMLSKAKGFGKKFAERIVSELKDKVTANNNEIFPGENPSSSRLKMKDAVDALVSLGFLKRDAEKAVDSFILKNPGNSVEEVIKGCLKS